MMDLHEAKQFLNKNGYILVESETEIYPILKDLAGIIADAGYDLYIIGGAVRDEFLGKTPNDYDLTTDMPADQLQKLIGSGQIVDRKDKTMFFVEYEGQTFEISCGMNVIDQLKQGDLTINSMAKNVLSGEIVDPTGGQKDLKSKTLRFTQYGMEEVGSGYSNLKMGRLLYFIARFNWKVDKKSKEAFIAGVESKRNAHQPCYMLKKMKDKLKLTPYKDKAIEFGLDCGLNDEYFRGI